MAAGVSCDTSAAREVVGDFGERLRSVPLLAPDSILDRELTAAYGSLVTPELLGRWLASASEAPGRETSSPWPQGIEIDLIAADDGSCVAYGTVVYVTSVEEVSGGAAARRPIRLRLVGDGAWLIEAVELGPPANPEEARFPAPGAGGDRDRRHRRERPGGVLRRYYAAIDAEAFAEAYALWGDGGRASGQTLDEFVSGFDSTDSVSVQVGEPGRIEGAAGSRYVEVPVVVQAWLEGGAEQRFAGSYTLRRSMVDGATAAQRAWHIHSAEIEQIR